MYRLANRARENATVRSLIKQTLGGPNLGDLKPSSTPPINQPSLLDGAGLSARMAFVPLDLNQRLDFGQIISNTPTEFVPRQRSKSAFGLADTFGMYFEHRGDRVRADESFASTLFVHRWRAPFLREPLGAFFALRPVVAFAAGPGLVFRFSAAFKSDALISQRWRPFFTAVSVPSSIN